MNKKKVQRFDLIGHIKQYFKLYPYLPIIEWALKNIDFSLLISALRNKLDFKLYPYQVPILKLWLNGKKVIKTIVVVAPEQVGKTNMFVVGILYNMQYNPCQSLIVYPSDDLAITTNQTKLKPLMKHIPALKELLDKPRSCRSDCYKFSNLISYFQGAGSKIVSRSCKIVVGDEIDAWPTMVDNDNVADLMKRTRSYNSSITFLISTPKYEKDGIWLYFLKGSQGYWYLRCKGCGLLTMRSCDVHNMQFESDLNLETKNRIVRTESIRLICPKCKHEHVEADKAWMNLNGGFIHLAPLKLEKAPSYQIGALASQLPALCWTNIANAQLEAGKSSELKIQKKFDNSWRGLPFKPRQVSKEDIEKIRLHEWRPSEAPKQDEILMVFVTADTQDNRSVVGVWAFDVNDNMYLLKASLPQYLSLEELQRKVVNEELKAIALKEDKPFIPVETVEDILLADYLVLNGVGIKPTFIVLDRRGHRARDIDYFIKTHDNAIAWLGSKLQSCKYRPSDSIYKGVLASAINYQIEAIWYLHTQKKRDSLYMFFYPDILKAVLDEIIACQPDPNIKFGHHPLNWTFGNRIHDWFDVTKMACFARLYAIENLMKKRFRFCKSPRLLRKFEEQNQNEVKTAQELIRKTSWFADYHY